jgi:hypothetical protein
MLKTLKRETLVPILTASFIGIVMLPGYARADGGGEYDFPAANYVGNGSTDEARTEARTEERTPETIVCAEAKKVAWFEAQEALTDGNSTPDVRMPAECDRSILASTGSDDE